jgi:hypothetical protein
MESLRAEIRTSEPQNHGTQRSQGNKKIGDRRQEDRGKRTDDR